METVMTIEQLTSAISEKAALIEKVTTELGGTNDASKIVSLKGTPEEKFAQFETLIDELSTLEKQKKFAKKTAKATKQVAKVKKSQETNKYKGVNFNPNGGKSATGEEVYENDFKSLSHIKIPIAEKAMHTPRLVKPKAAYAMGMYARSLYSQNESARKYAGDWCNDNLNMKALGGLDNDTGGALVPYEFLPILVNLIEQYGVARSNMNMLPMRERIMPFPRLDTHVDMAWEDENASPSESSMAFSNIELVAKKMFGWLAIPYELMDDAALAVGEIVMRDFAWRASKKEDDAFFNGDGTKTYGKVTGLINKMQGLGTYANTAGLTVSASTTMAGITRTEILSAMSKLPAYVYKTGNPKFYCSYGAYVNILLRNAISQSTYGTEVVDGVPRLRFDGYEVVPTQVMPFADAVSQVCLIFGDINLAAKMADRKQYTIATSEHVRFLNDQIVFKATERVAMAIHDVGNNDATAANRVPGPVVMLQTAAS